MSSSPEVPASSGEDRLRIGLLIDRFEPERGGAEGALTVLARHLARRGHDVRICAERGVELEGARLHTVSPGLARFGGRVRKERALGQRLVELADELGCEVTVGIRHLPRVDLYWPHHGTHAGVLEARARRRRRAGRTDAPRPGGRHALFLELERRLFAGGARRIACVSRAVAEEIGRFYPEAADRLVRVDNGVDLERFGPPDGELRERASELRRRFGDPAAPLVVFAARHPRDKGLPELARALGRLGARPWNLLVAGARRPAAWRRHLARGLPRERVLVTGRLDAAVLLAAADLVAVPTWRDACLSLALESLAAGTPVVTSAHAGVTEVVDHPEAGRVVDEPDDTETLAEALESWLGRIERGAVDPARVRERVVGRGLEPWLARLEVLCVGLARERTVP